jgi:zinc protease
LHEETLKNGLHLLILEDHEVPLVNGFLLSEVGSWLDPPEKTGLADMVTDLLREGGSSAYDAAALDEFLANRAASIETSSSVKSVQIGFQSEPVDLEPVLRAVGSLVRAPLFPDDKLELMKQRQHANIARRNDEPSLVLQRAFSKLLYGKDSPFAREPTDESIDRIRREDLLQFHAENFGPDANSFLVLYGDLDQADARRIAVETFGDWPRLFNSTRPPLPAAPVPNPEASMVLLADKPGLTQAQVAIGQIGGTFRDPLYPSLDVMNALMNGLGGRLFDELRSRRGLAYSVYGVWAPKYNYPGLFMAGGETETSQVPALVDGIEAEFRRLDSEQVSPDELTYAKDFVLNSMVFEMAPNKSEMLRRLVLYRFHGYPDDFLVSLRSAIEQVNADSIQRAARERIHDESFITLVLGDRAKLEPLLRSHFGQERVRIYSLER